jgi:hypothetical protein
MNKVNKILLGVNIVIITLNLGAFYKIKFRKDNDYLRNIKRYDIENDNYIDIYYQVVKIDTINYIGRVDCYWRNFKIVERMILVDKNYAIYIKYNDKDSIEKYLFVITKWDIKGQFVSRRYGYDEQHPDCYE